MALGPGTGGGDRWLNGHGTGWLLTDAELCVSLVGVADMSPSLADRFMSAFLLTGWPVCSRGLRATAGGFAFGFGLGFGGGCRVGSVVGFGELDSAASDVVNTSLPKQ